MAWNRSDLLGRARATGLVSMKVPSSAQGWVWWGQGSTVEGLLRQACPGGQTHSGQPQIAAQCQGETKSKLIIKNGSDASGKENSDQRRRLWQARKPATQTKDQRGAPGGVSPPLGLVVPGFKEQEARVAGCFPSAKTDAVNTG